MKSLLENWRQYQDGPKVFYVAIEKLIPMEELGHGKPHECPSKECEQVIDDKISKIMAGKFDPIAVCHQKPVPRNGEYVGDKENLADKDPREEPFYYVLDGHHRLEAAKRIGLRKVPVIRVEDG
tara:strand:- start:210 stop:581 length:372 start_codon:yes stop_codon:yes gene_type:complete